MPLASGQFTIHVHPTGAQGQCRRRGFVVVGRFKRIDCCSLNRLARRRLYLVLPSIGGWRFSHMCRSRQNTNTDVNKPIQIQNSLAKSPPWSAGIDMDRSFCALVELRHCVGAIQAHHYVVVRLHESPFRRRVQSPPDRRVGERTSRRRSCYFSVKRTEATDLPAFETATTALVPAGTLKLPNASSLPSPARS